MEFIILIIDCNMILKNKKVLIYKMSIIIYEEKQKIFNQGVSDKYFFLYFDCLKL